jgi:hypothetical protein
MDSRLQHSSPLIVVGMHRSGTRLLAQVLARLGVFMGDDQQADSESLMFMSINEGILHQCGAFWSEPMSAHFLLSQPESVSALAASVRATLASRFGEFLGRSGWHWDSGAGRQRPFGWKDPRNTFTLPVWRQVFPNARVVHVVRHGVDVAASLARRHAAALREASGERWPSALTVVQDHAAGILSSRRGWTLAEALTMWEQYVEKARVEMADAASRALEVRYEALLQTPDEVVSDIARFCGLPVPAQDADWLRSIRSDRAFAYRRDVELTAFAESNREALERYGYTP